MLQRKRVALKFEGIMENSILPSILSSLSMREAVRTSILSSRWRSLWTYMPNLYFDGHSMLEAYPETLPKLSLQERVNVLEERTDKFVRCVDEFLRRHRGVGVQRFLVDFFLHKEHADHLDQWIGFAISSGAKDLILELYDHFGFPRITEPYEFPCQLFAGGRGSSVERIYLHSCSLSVPANFDGFNSLKLLTLNKVNVNERDIQGLLSSCPTLESLSIKESKGLVSLKVSCPSEKLKYLNVKWCPLQKIEFFTTNLTMFEYRGRKVSLTFTNAPRLVKAYFYIKKLEVAIDYLFTGLPLDMPHLESLFFAVYPFSKVGNLPIVSNKFTHLKYLVIVISSDWLEEFLWVASLLSVAPFLEKFELHLHLCRRSDEEERAIRRPPKCSTHNQVKAIEICGFTGTISQIEFAICMLNNAIALEIMTITAGTKYYMGEGKWNFSEDDSDAPKLRRMASEYLYGECPPGAKIVIL